MGRLRVAIVIPAFNESLTIANIVKSVAKYGTPIVIDDGSTDNTASLALNSGALLVVHEVNKGYDSAINSGFIKAATLGSDIVLTLDADGQHNPLIIQQFIDAIQLGADVVIGIRSRQQRFAEHLFSWYTYLRFGLRDPLCGMKAYRLSVYEALGHFDSYGSIGTELMLYAIKQNYRVAQIPFNIRERADNPRFGRIFEANLKIIRSIFLSVWHVNEP